MSDCASQYYVGVSRNEDGHRNVTAHEDGPPLTSMENGWDAAEMVARNSEKTT